MLDTYVYNLIITFFDLFLAIIFSGDPMRMFQNVFGGSGMFTDFNFASNGGGGGPDVGFF